MKNVFISCEKLFSFLRYLSFYPDFCGHLGKQVDEKAKVIFKIYVVGTELDYNTSIS